MKQILKKLTENMADYRPFPFWSWNDKLEPEKLKSQIHWMHENGIGGFFMHARGGLKTPYLSEEWMECIETCCDEAKKLGMKAWAYDENGWPSGFAGGKLLEEPSNRDMYILKKEGDLDADADVSYLLEGKRLIRTTEWEAGKTYLNLYFKRSASTVDILNPDIVDKFLDITHRQYKEHLGENFAKKLKGFFTDEPQYYRWDTPYTPMVAEYFEKEYHENVLDGLGLLFVEKEGYRGFRYRYWMAMQKLMLQNYAKKVYDWCEENGVQLTGHFIEETSMGFQLMCCGGVMPFYKYEHIPGIDWLGSTTDNELPPRQLGSVARQLGKRQAVTETFGCCGWDVTPAELRRVAGFQFANGANVICHHLVPYSEHGQRKRDYPAHFVPLNPWVKEHFKAFNDSFTRLGYLLGEGKEPVNVAMLHPMRSAYFDYKRDMEQEGFCIGELDKKLREACRLLSARGIAYHFLDETLMEEHGFVVENKIGCGKCSYDYLVLPKVLTMGKNTEILIRQFVANGGKVLLLEGAPEYLEGEPYQYTYLESNCTLEDITQAQPFEVENTDTELYYAYRTVNGTPFLFVQNASKENSYTQTFRLKDGSVSFTSLDLNTLNLEKQSLTVTLQKEEAILLLPSAEQVVQEEELSEKDLIFEDASVSFDTNYLTVNVVRYSKDGVKYSEPMYKNALFQQLLEERYQGKLWLRYDFEVQTIPEKLTLMAEQDGVASCNVNGQEIQFTDRYEDETSFWTADITDKVHLGTNFYESVLDWEQSEATYYALFGENVTESLKNCIAYDSEIEAIYLSGRFGVYSHTGFTPHDAETVCAHDFYIGKLPERISEPTTDGFPFFRGKLTMSQDILLDTENMLLKVPGHYLTAKVWINEKEAGELFFERKLDISQYAVKGENNIKVEFTIGNRNLMGPFHYEKPEAFVGPMTFDACDLPKSQDGWPQYRFYRFYKDSEV